jgi:putative endonuclease
VKRHQYFVYILKCSDNSYYTGVTNNIERRFNEHKSKINPNCYTASRLPVQLVFIQEFQYIDKAIDFEKQVKGWSRKKKEAIISDNWNQLKKLAKKKFNKE